MVKKNVLFILLLNICFLGYSQQLMVAVTDFTASSGYSKSDLDNTTELFAGIFMEVGGVRVVTRNQWRAILGEHEFQRSSGLVARGEIKELGKALGAQAVVTGTLMKLGNTNILNLSLLDVESGEMLSTARKSYESLDEFLSLLPALAADMSKLLKKSSPLVGRWKVEGQTIIFIFNENNTFEIQDCRFVNNFTRHRTVTAPDGRVGVQYEYLNYNGNIRGTYSNTSNEIVVSGNFSGIIQTLRIWNDMSGRSTVKTENNRNVSFKETFRYSLSDRNIIIFNNCLFLRYYFSFTSSGWNGVHYTKLIRVQ